MTDKKHVPNKARDYPLLRPVYQVIRVGNAQKRPGWHAVCKIRFIIITVMVVWQTGTEYR